MILHFTIVNFFYRCIDQSARAILSNALVFYVFLPSLLSVYHARDVPYIRREASDKIHSAYCISVTLRRETRKRNEDRGCDTFDTFESFHRI